MQTRVCFVYPWATFGGVERVFINRALAFKYYLPQVHVDLYFLHDAGGLHCLIAALAEYDLNETASVVYSLDAEYDLVFLIDCPQAIELCTQKKQRYVMECHTSYANNRRYLAHLPTTCERIITPSSVFSRLIGSEYSELKNKIRELRNFVPWDINYTTAPLGNFLPPWTRKPILFFGRLDNLKDPVSLLDAFKLLNNRRPNEFMLILCGPKTPDIDINTEIENRVLEGMTVVLPPIPFASANDLLSSVAHLGGVFVSPSKGESFGLSAAEAISALLPVVLSDIEPHLELLKEDHAIFSYPLGNTKQLSLCIESIFENYSNACQRVNLLRGAFSANAFVEDWKHLCSELGIVI